MASALVRRATLALALACFAAHAWSQASYPAKPVRLIVPFPPGQASDIFGRMVAERLAATWGQPVVVENRAGGGGVPGVMAVKDAAPDGYTLLMGSSGTLGVNPGLYAKLPYDPLRDFAPASNVFLAPQVLVANPAFAPKTIQEIVAAAKKEPGKLNYASAGPGTAQHMVAELFKLRAAIDLVHVPYKGSGPAMTDVMGGQVPMMLDAVASALPHIRSGKVRAIAVTAATRVPQLPDVPTIAESGYPGFRRRRLVRHPAAGRHAARDRRARERGHPEGACRPAVPRADRRARRDARPADAAGLHRIHPRRNREVDRGREGGQREARLRKPMSTKSDFRIVVLPGDGIGVEVMDACLAVLPLLQRTRRRVPARVRAPRRRRRRLSRYRRRVFRHGDEGERARRRRCSSARWGCRTCAIPTAPRSRRSSTCATSSSCTPACARSARSPGPRCRSPTRARARSTSSWCASRPKAGSTAATTSRRRRLRPTTRPSTSAASPARPRTGCSSSRSGSPRSAARATRRKAASPASTSRTSIAGWRSSTGCSGSARSATRRLTADHCYIDAMALNLVRKPWEYDVLPTENQFGDILSDLAAGLVGGMGMAPSGDIGDEHALFQPCHGTAPDIAGKGLANPDGDASLGGDDARLARRAARRCGNASTRRSSSKRRSTASSPSTPCSRPSSAAGTAPRAVTKAVIAAVEAGR